MLLVSPSGNWAAQQFPDTSDVNNTISAGITLETYNDPAANIVSFTNSPGGPMMNLNGELSTGTWTVYLVDVTKDGKIATLTDDLAAAPTPTAGGNPITLTLSGVSSASLDSQTGPPCGPVLISFGMH